LFILKALTGSRVACATKGVALPELRIIDAGAGGFEFGEYDEEEEVEEAGMPPATAQTDVGDPLTPVEVEGASR